MDRAKAIAINQAALRHIVAALVAMVRLTADDVLARLPRPVYRAALTLLRPTEAALRRLIVLAAQGVVAKPHTACQMPADLAANFAARSTLPAHAGTRASFQLFDARQRLPSLRSRSVGPRVSLCGGGAFSPHFQSRAGRAAEPEHDNGTVDATRLGRRLLAVKRALENLPRQVQRLKRWQARRARMTNPKFRLPMRPGWPPGHRKAPKDEVDRVLRECDALARDALRDDSS